MKAESKSSIHFVNKTYPHHSILESIIGCSLNTSTKCKLRYDKGKTSKGIIHTKKNNRSVFNQTPNTAGPLCKYEEEDTVCFLSNSAALENMKKATMVAMLQQIQHVYSQYPGNSWEAPFQTQLVLDPPHPDIIDMLPLHRPSLYQLERCVFSTS